MRCVLAHLVASIGAGKQHLGSPTGQSAGGTRGAEVAQALDDGLDEALLAEAGLGEGREGEDGESLALHFDQRKQTIKKWWSKVHGK